MTSPKKFSVSPIAAWTLPADVEPLPWILLPKKPYQDRDEDKKHRLFIKGFEPDLRASPTFDWVCQPPEYVLTNTRMIGKEKMTGKEKILRDIRDMFDEFQANDPIGVTLVFLLSGIDCPRSPAC